MRRLINVFLMGACLFTVAPAFADDAPPKATKSDFQKAERLDALRYKNMWLAYGGAWFIVFLFVLRTHKQAGSTEDTLTDLKQRIKKLEQDHG